MNISKRSIAKLVFGLACSVGLISCSRDNPVGPAVKTGPTTPPGAPDDSSVVFGDAKLSRQELRDLSCNQIAVATAEQKFLMSGLPSFSGLFDDFSKGNIDLATLSSISFSFHDGIYEMTDGQKSIRLVFRFADTYSAGSWGSFAAGDTNPFNVFSTDSYVRNVKISFGGVTYDEGPLYHLVDISVRLNGLKLSVKVTPKKMTLSYECEGIATFSTFPSPDTLRMVLRSVEIPIEQFPDIIRNGGVAGSFDSMTFSCASHSLSGNIQRAIATMKLVAGHWQPDLEFWSLVTVNGTQVYVWGLVSIQGTSQFRLYRDSEFTDLVGIAYYNSSTGAWYFQRAEHFIVRPVALP